MELDVCLLGTGGMLPLPDRRLTSLLLRHAGRCLLIDCGEGTQTALRAAGRSPARIDAILLTHLHADHTAGLPGLLLTMGNCGRREPVRVIGPAGARRLAEAALVFAPEVPFPLECAELAQPIERLSLCGCEVEAFAVEHRVPCYGYAVRVPRAGRFHAERARALGIPQRLWGALQAGARVEHEGRTYGPEDVLGPPRRGVKVTYCTDTRPVPRIEECAAGSDLLILEGMYGDPAMGEKAREKKHMTMGEAAEIAAKAGAGELWLTHFSPAETDPHAWEEDVRRVFANAHVGRDGMSRELGFSKAGEEA